MIRPSLLTAAAPLARPACAQIPEPVAAAMQFAASARKTYE